MNYYLPTRDECQALTEKSEAFYCSTKTIEGQVVEMYDYRLAGYTDFFPEDGSNWTELRGLTFVQQADGTWERNILLQKFFNINQTTDWMYDDVKDKKIVRIQNKEDGSIISFIKFANGNVRAKSKMSFESPQAVMAQELYDNDEILQDFILTMIESNKTPIFELTSPYNQIVLEYHETSLVLLQVRDSIGDYYSELPTYNRRWNIRINEHSAYTSSNTLDLLIREKKSNQDAIEGWVVTFEDGQMAKIKTDKYLQLHGLIGPDAFRENLLVKTILDGNIDDVISALVPGVKKDRIISLDEKVTKHFNHLVNEFHLLRAEYFGDYYKEDRKRFAIDKKHLNMFSGVMKTLPHVYSENMSEEQVTIYILQKCNGLNDAKKYLEGL